MKRCRRTFIQLLLICMVILGTLGVSRDVHAASKAVAKVGNKKYASLDKAFKAVKGKGTIKLLKNVTLKKNIYLDSKKTITVNLNKHTITTKKSGGFTINKGKVTFKNGTLKDKQSANAKYGVYNIISIYKKGSVVLNNVNYYGHIQIGGYYYAKNNGSLRIKGGTFKPAGDSWLISNFGKLVIDKGNFQFPGTDTHYGILRTFKDCTINGGNFTTYGQYSILIDTNGFDGHRGKTTINGGTFTYPWSRNRDWNYGVILNEKSDTTLAGGTIQSSVQIVGGKLVMKGGSITGVKSAVWVDDLYGGPKGSFSKTGGTITEYERIFN